MKVKLANAGMLLRESRVLPRPDDLPALWVRTTVSLLEIYDQGITTYILVTATRCSAQRRGNDYADSFVRTSSERADHGLRHDGEQLRRCMEIADAEVASALAWFEGELARAIASGELE